MREIKFRAWDKQTNHYWYLNIGNMVFEYSKKGGNIHVLRLSAIEVFNNSDRFVIEQSTGLKDKNGKEIFEGSLVKYTEEDGELFIAEVKCFAKDGYPAFDVEPPNEFDFESNVLSAGVANNCLKVVGDVHNNPDLLEMSE